MLERLGVLLFSTLLVAGSLAGAVWIIATGQLQGIDGIFLMLVCLVLALVFAIVAHSLVKNAMATATQPAAAKAKAVAKPAAAAGTAEAHSQPAATH
ncbi:MAG TPA: hypothetical protein VEU62_17600 [Bryobacterales bacterium]|nr:hypothetical protein [Bryobacterales bacterium]